MPAMTRYPPPATRHISYREQLGAGLLFAAAALLLVPTFARGLACGHDTLTHFYRIVQVALNVQEGAPFSLWSPYFMRGYGYTIFPFYAPLSYWGTAVLHFLGPDFSAALRLAAWLMLWLAGWGGYNMGRRIFSPPAAFVTGLAYLFAPYLLYNATQRGAFPELWGLALLPWALAAGDVALARRTPRAFAVAALTFAPLVLAHNIAPNFGFALLLALGLRHSRSARPREVWTALWPATAVVVLALALTAFFWLPAYAELDFTQSRRADSPFANWPRYEQHFVAWGDMAGWPPEPGDPALTNPPLVMTVGVGTAVLALFGYAANFFQRKSRPDLWRWAWLWGLITAVALFLASPASAWLWGNLPLPEFVQLPFRFLGPASLGVAVLAGAALERLETGDWRLRRISNLQSPISNLLFLAAVLLVAMSGWFWLYPVVCAVPAATAGTAAMTPTAVAEATVWDEAGHVQQWGGDSLGETLPRWVDTLPPANELLHNSQFTIHNSPFTILFPARPPRHGRSPHPPIPPHRRRLPSATHRAGHADLPHLLRPLLARHPQQRARRPVAAPRRRPDPTGRPRRRSGTGLPLRPDAAAAGDAATQRGGAGGAVLVGPAA
jgi:hypothetical protein